LRACPNPCRSVYPRRSARWNHGVIRGTPEFTVNIALVEHGTPVAGAVYAPALQQLYLGGSNAYKLEARADSGTLSFSKMHPIAVRSIPPEGCRAVVSRSHRISIWHPTMDRAI
jgi:3'-phosphoadenosine 5'-phosphosulfate (PAPS) 3'-phosphatase